MKIKTLLLSLLIFLTASLRVEASQLPKELRDYLVSQKKVPSIRFDAVVVYNDDVMYLPVYPSHPVDVDKVQILKTIPENQTMDKLPDVVIFNNNMGLLKVVKNGESSFSIKEIENLPTEIKTGLLPQDLMVPRGLVFPENLAPILGDVKIPTKGSAKAASFVTRKVAPLPTGKKVVDTNRADVPLGLRDKLFFVNNFQTEYLQIFSSSVSEPLYSLKTSGVMKDVKPVMGGKFLLVATSNKKNIDVVDVQNEYVAKHIDLTSNPSEIIVDDLNKKAYVASVTDESLSIIDLNTMTMKEKIQLVGAPQRLALSPDYTKLAYTDMKTSNIYILDLVNGYENKLITNFPNITKMILKDNIMYMVSRSNPKMRVVYFDLLQDNQLAKTKKDKKKEETRRKLEKMDDESLADDLISGYSGASKDDKNENLIEQNVKMYATSIKDIEVGKKPVDMYSTDSDIFILCAGDNSVYKFNMISDEINFVKLPVDGFSKSFTPVPNSNLAVITNMADLKYVVYDMETDKAIQTLPINDYINTITILDRINE